MPPASSVSKRIPVFELARCAAAFGVIAIHCAPYTPAAGAVVDFSLNFCVPFFLLTSLVFFCREVERTGDAAFALRRRVPRLLIPYAAWTVIYVAARCGKHALAGGGMPEGLRSAGIPEIIGAGAGAVHLYFLPLLALALLLARLLSPLLWRARPWHYAGLLLIGGAVLARTPEWIPNGAPPSLGRLAERYLDWATWMLPVVVAAAAVSRWMARAGRKRRLGWLLLAGAIALDAAVTARSVPYAWRLHSLVIAALVFGACAQGETAGASIPHWVEPVLRTSFGVFLSHHMILEGVEFADRRMGGHLTQPYSFFSIFLVCLVVFALSAAFTLAMMRQRHLAHLLLGQ